MKIKLIWSETAPHPPAAAFLAGTSPALWLAEISSWGIPFGELECYVLPESLHSVQAAGLLVVFKNGETARQLELKTPYARIADRLFIPIQATVYPEIGIAEWPQLLSWDVQVLHPAIGLVGFQHSDRLDPATLLADMEPAVANWTLASRGLPPRPPLAYIAVVRPSPEELIASIREEMAPLPLEDIPKEEDDEPTPLQKWLDGAKQELIRGTLSALDQLDKALPKAPPGASNGWMGQFREWLERNLEELERRRNNELKRLLRLFDENSDEALRYAIPLDSTYAPRGTAPPSWKLGPRSTNFDLRRIGGGDPVDAWDTGNYYFDLQTKYRRAANEAIAKGDFRRAAYIHAHLLGDFQAAANVLKQGKHYREAAVLYKDHLKNLPAAAECLETGGFYSEAIELYDELQQYEKAGDLYQQTGQPDKASVYYEKSVSAVLGNDDYLDASRVIEEKLQQPERAKSVLLQGWQGAKQPEACLKKYFDRVLETDANNAPQRIQEVFEQQTPREKRPQFLNTLLYLNERQRSTGLLDASRPIAYEIIGDAAGQGDLSALQTLPKFLPADRLIAGDTSRFVNKQKNAKTRQNAFSRIQLDPGIEWLNAAGHHNQFLAAGLNNGRLHLARGTWYGHVEYYSWEQPVYDNPRPAFILNPAGSADVFIRCANRQSLNVKVLPRNKYFDTELRVGYPAWLPRHDLGLSIEKTGQLVALIQTNGKLDLQFYTLSGELQGSVNCVTSWQTSLPAPLGLNFPGLVSGNGNWYSYNEDLLSRFGADGSVQQVHSFWRIRRLCCTDAYQPFRLVALTDNGCALIRPDAGAKLRDTDFFARDFTPVLGAFIAGGHFLVASGEEVKIYRIDDSGVYYQKSVDCGFTSQPVALLHTFLRDRFAVLDKGGEIRVFDL